MRSPTARSRRLVSLATASRHCWSSRWPGPGARDSSAGARYTSPPMRPRRLLLVAPLLGLGCAARASAPAFIVPGAGGSDVVAGALAAAPLPPDQNLRAQAILEGREASVSVVQIRDREQPHVHIRYDLTVLLARGRGTLWLDGVGRPMRPGDATFIPAGTPHFFVNEGDEPAVAVVVYAPPFSGPDLAPVP